MNFEIFFWNWLKDIQIHCFHACNNNFSLFPSLNSIRQTETLKLLSSRSMFAQSSIIHPPQTFLSQVRRLSIFSTFIFFLATFRFTRFILTKKRAYLPWNFKDLSFPFMPIHFIINFHFIVRWFYRPVSVSILSIFRNFVES